MSKPSIVERVYPERGWGGFTRIDGTVQFYQRVQALKPASGTVLDLGCGRGKQQDDPCEYRRRLQDMRSPQHRVIGIDVDRAGESNPYLDEFRWIEDTGNWPIEDQSIALIVSDFVLEHVPDPASFFSEARRVLQPGGYLCLRTPNAWSYVAIASRLVPNRLHARVLRVAQGNRQERDVFPTVYRCNTAGRMRRMMRENGLESLVFYYESEPGYLAFSSLFYRVAAALQPLLPPMFRTTLLGFARKPVA